MQNPTRCVLLNFDAPGYSFYLLYLFVWGPFWGSFCLFLLRFSGKGRKQGVISQTTVVLKPMFQKYIYLKYLQLFFSGLSLEIPRALLFIPQLLKKDVGLKVKAEAGNERLWFFLLFFFKIELLRGSKAVRECRDNLEPFREEMGERGKGEKKSQRSFVLIFSGDLMGQRESWTAF